MNHYLWASLARGWLRHTTTQLTTLIVLIASYTVVCTFFTLGQNLNSVLTLWGDSIQMTVYINDDVNDQAVNQLKTKLQSIEGVADIQYVSKQEAAEKFKMDMSGFMPEVFRDEEFIAPFPSSFILKFKDKLKQKIDTERLGKIASLVSSFEGADDISYGQDWLQNYAGFVSGIGKMGLGLIVILLSASIFVVGTSVKTSISSRREEIEILELVGATPWRIRLPYVVEGMMMGLISSSIAVLSTLFIYSFIRESFATQAVFLTVKQHLQFLTGIDIFLFILAGTAFGGLSAYFFVRKLNHGWLASQRSEI